MHKSDQNFMEDDYIIAALDCLVSELSTDKSKDQIVDKYACILTGYMRGQQSVRITKQTFSEWLDSEFPAIDLNDKTNQMLIEYMEEAYHAGAGENE